jgi:phosphoribosylamine--glycine ligase
VEDRAFGDAGSRVVLEEWLDGEEASVTCLVDGEEVRALVPSQDHKRARDGDRGPNTGGMGAYAPYPGLDDAAHRAAVETCVRPIARGLVRRGIEFRGVLYAGLMLTKDGPRVLEYNVRLGDPESQVIVPLAGDGLLETLAACAQGELAQAPPRLRDIRRRRTGAARFPASSRTTTGGTRSSSTRARSVAKTARW